MNKNGYVYLNAEGITLKTTAEENKTFAEMVKNAAATGKLIVIDGVKMDTYIAHSVPVEVNIASNNIYLTFIARATSTTLNAYMITINTIPNVVSYAKKTISLT